MFDVDTWAEVEWPEWVPEGIRQRVEDFWGPTQHRTPRDYLHNAIENRAPRLGLRIQAEDYYGNLVAGRFVFAWNTCGRLVDSVGKVLYIGFQPFKVSRDAQWQQPVAADFEEAL